MDPGGSVDLPDRRTGRPTTLTEFQKEVLRLAVNKTIILTTTDYFSIDMAFNLYRTSMEKFDIHNYLFGALHYKAHNKLREANIK